MPQRIQLDLFEPLELPVPNRELCFKWKSATKNDCGVYTKDSHAFPAGSYKDYFLELKLALCYPYVVGAIGLQSTKDSSYGRGSPLTDEHPLCRFNVFDGAERVRTLLTNSLTDEILCDGNLCEASRNAFVKKLIPAVVDKAMASMEER